MNTWVILKNIGLVIQFFKSLRGVVMTVAINKEMPAKAQVKNLMDQLEALLDSGAIDIPGVDEKAISEALQQIEDQICG